MANNYRITDLVSASNLTNDDLFVIVDMAPVVTKKLTSQQLLNYVTGSTFNTHNVISLTGSQAIITLLTGTVVTGTDAKFSTITGSTVTGSTALFSEITGTNISGNLAAFNILTGSTVTGSTAIFTTITGTNITGSSAKLTTINVVTEVCDYLTGSYVTGNVANYLSVTASFKGDLNGTASNAELLDGHDSAEFPRLGINNTYTGINIFSNTITGTYAYFANDVYINGTASIAHLNTVSQSSLVIGDKYITILSGGADHVSLDGSGILWGSGGVGPTVDELGANAHLRFRSTIDQLEIFPGLYVSGAITASAEISGTISYFSTVNSNNGVFTRLTGSTITGSTGLINVLTSSNANILTALITTLTGTTITGSTAIYGTITGSIITGSRALFTTLTGSTITGSTGLINVLTGSTITGSSLLYTTVTGNNIIASTNLAVGKGTANFTLDVLGNTVMSGNLTVTGSITELSTRRIKTNIETISDQLNNIIKLNPVSYNRISDNKKEYGFISEEVKEVYPEFVVGEGINYPKMVSILVSAVKELKQKLEQQQEEIDLLKKL